MANLQYGPTNVGFTPTSVEVVNLDGTPAETFDDQGDPADAVIDGQGRVSFWADTGTYLLKLDKPNSTDQVTLRVTLQEPVAPDFSGLNVVGDPADGDTLIYSSDDDAWVPTTIGSTSTARNDTNAMSMTWSGWIAPGDVVTLPWDPDTAWPLGDDVTLEDDNETITVVDGLYFAQLQVEWLANQSSGTGSVLKSPQASLEALTGENNTLVLGEMLESNGGFISGKAIGCTIQWLAAGTFRARFANIGQPGQADIRATSMYVTITRLK